MKKLSWCTFFYLSMFIPFVMGMGVLGEGPANQIPAPGKKFSATFIDQTDMVTTCSEVSIEGNTFIEGKIGEGTYTIPFEKIAGISFVMKGNELSGLVKMTDRSEANLILKKELKAYGRTSYGTYQIKLSSLKKMILKDTQSSRKE